MEEDKTMQDHAAGVTGRTLNVSVGVMMICRGERVRIEERGRLKDDKKYHE